MAVSLRPLAAEHLDDVTALFDDPDVLRFTRLPVPPPPGYARQWLDRYEAGRLDGTREAFAAFDPEGRFVGLALAVDIDREGREVELGYIVKPGSRGRGVATGMLGELTRWAFDELGALRITLIIDVENRASARVAERCGYVLEGVMRSSHLKDDVRVDAGLWSRLPTHPWGPATGQRCAANCSSREGSGGRHDARGPAGAEVVRTSGAFDNTFPPPSSGWSGSYIPQMNGTAHPLATLVELL